jgi:hypothetical protein
MAFAVLWESLYPEIDLFAQHQFMSDRGFTLDFVSIEGQVAIEIHGSIWRQGGHNTGDGLLRDYQKQNYATALGWAYFELAPELITAEWLELIAKTIQVRSLQIKESNDDES